MVNAHDKRILSPPQMKILPRFYTLRGQGFPSPLRRGGLGWGVYFHGKCPGPPETYFHCISSIIGGWLCADQDMQTRNQLLHVRLQAQGARLPCGWSRTYPGFLNSYLPLSVRDWKGIPSFCLPRRSLTIQRWCLF